MSHESGLTPHEKVLIPHESGLTAHESGLLSHGKKEAFQRREFYTNSD